MRNEKWSWFFLVFFTTFHSSFCRDHRRSIVLNFHICCDVWRSLLWGNGTKGFSFCCTIVLVLKSVTRIMDRALTWETKSSFMKANHLHKQTASDAFLIAQSWFLSSTLPACRWKKKRHKSFFNLFVLLLKTSGWVYV